MHVPGVVQDIKEAVGTSPALFTVSCFGRAKAIVQETADRLFLFPMEGDLESAKRAVTDGLWPGEVSALILYTVVRYRCGVDITTPCCQITVDLLLVRLQYYIQYHYDLSPNFVKASSLAS